MTQSMSSPLVSVIMPAYEAGNYITNAIDSVLAQSYSHWELLIINDGSNDDTENLISLFYDKRIRYFYQENKGVSAARNVGLKNMQGDFFCFLDADDFFTPESLALRIKIFESNPTIEFVDGSVEVFKDQSNEQIRVFMPDFNGNPLNELISLSGKCFFGPTWMIKMNTNKRYRFKEGLTHGEDLLFYISISNTGKYSFTQEVIYKYRTGNISAMSNLNKLEEGYLAIYDEISDKYEGSRIYRKKVKLIMFKSYLSRVKIYQAFRSLFR